MNAYDERAQYNWPDESHEQEVVRDTPTVFHSHTAGWHDFGLSLYVFSLVILSYCTP